MKIPKIFLKIRQKFIIFPKKFDEKFDFIHTKSYFSHKKFNFFTRKSGIPIKKGRNYMRKSGISHENTTNILENLTKFTIFLFSKNLNKSFYFFNSK